MVNGKLETNLYLPIIFLSKKPYYRGKKLKVHLPLVYKIMNTLAQTILPY